MRLSPFALLALLALSMSTAAAQAVEEGPIRRTWRSFGFGVAQVQVKGTELERYLEDYGVDYGEGLAGHFGYHWQRGPVLVSLRSAATVSIDFDFDFGPLGIDGPGDALWGDAGALAGLATTWRRFHVTAAAGGGVVYGRGGTGVGPFTEASVPVEVQVFYGATDFLAAGLYGFANVNAAQPFAGVTVSLKFGDLW